MKNTPSLAFLVGISLAVLLIYFPVISGPLIWSDFVLLDRPGGHTGLYELGFNRPLPLGINLIEQRIASQAASHLLGMVIHILNAWLVFVAARGLLGGPWPAMIAASVFALHPAASEAVSWISARPSLLLGGLCLLSLGLLYKYVHCGRVIYALTGMTAYAMALCTMQGALVLPILWLAISWATQSHAKDIWRIRGVTIGLFSLALLYVLWLGWPGEFLHDAAIGDVPRLSVFQALGYYTTKLIAPSGMSLAPSLDIEAGYFIVPAMALTILILLYAERVRMEALGLTWVLVTLLPPMVLATSRHDPPLGDRYMYLPLIGLSFLVGAVASRLPRTRPVMGAFMAFLIVMGSMSHARARVWAEPLALWAEASATGSYYGVIRYNHSVALEAAGDLGGAKAEALAALSDPALPMEIATPALNGLMQRGVSDNELLTGLAQYGDQARAYHMLGLMYFNLGSGTEAHQKSVSYFTESLRLDDGLVDASFYLGLALIRAGDYEEGARRLAITRGIDNESYYEGDIVKILEALSVRGLVTIGNSPDIAE